MILKNSSFEDPSFRRIAMCFFIFSEMFDIFLLFLVDHWLIYAGFALVCHLGKHSELFISNLASIRYNHNKVIGVYRDGGERRKECMELSKWKNESIDYFNRYFNKRNVISIPFEKNDILETLSDWCKGENLEGKGLIVNGYDSVDHFKFLGVNQKDLSNILDVNPCLDNYSHYLAFSKDKGIILTIRVVEIFESQVVEQSVSDTKILTALYLEELRNSGIKVISVIVVKSQVKSVPLCTICETYLVNEETLRSTELFENWWKEIESDLSYTGHWESNVKSNFFELFCSKLIAFMAHATNYKMPDFSLPPNQQVQQTHLFLTEEQMGVVFMRSKHVFIKGSYGSGKTIIAQKKLEMIVSNIKNSEMVIYLNYDKESGVHIQVAEHVKYQSIVDPKKLQICEITRAFEQQNISVSICSNIDGLRLSEILTVIKENTSKLDKRAHMIIDEYDGEHLSMAEVMKCRELLNFFKDLNVMVLAQPLEKKRTYQCGRRTHTCDTNQFDELKNYVNIVELKKVFRTTLQIDKLLRVTTEYLQNQQNIFKHPSKKHLNSENGNIKVPGLRGEESKSSLSLQKDDIIGNKGMSKSCSSTELDASFKETSKDICQKSSSRKTLNDFKYNVDSELGHSISGPLPRLINFEMKDVTDNSKNTLFLSCIFNALQINWKKTVLLHFERETPPIILTALNLLDMQIFGYESLEAFIQKPMQRNKVMVTHFRHVNGMEFDNLIIVFEKNEYFLRHYIPLCISRCSSNLSILVLSDMKQAKRNRAYGIKHTFRLMKPISHCPNKNSKICDVTDIWKQAGAVEQLRIKVCKKCKNATNLSNICKSDMSIEIHVNSNKYDKLEAKIGQTESFSNIHKNTGNDRKEYLKK